MQINLFHARTRLFDGNCRDDEATAMVNFALDFCGNSDILLDLPYDQAGPRRCN
jgi:hypothetical protein